MRQLKIVSFGLVVPASGGGTAGGDFYADHVRALCALGHEVRVVVPQGGSDASAAEASTATETLLVRASPQWVSKWNRALNNFIPAGVRPAYRREIRRDAIIRDWVRDADVIEYQWAEFASLARTVEPLRARAGASWVVLHDELVQREWRRFRSARGLRRLLRGAAVLCALLEEHRSLSRVGNVLVLSEKDADRCRRVARRCAPRLVRPPVVEDTTPVVGSPDGRNVLFVGAMSRPENIHAVSWFHRQVWPTVRAEHPAARLVVAGARPTAETLALSAEDVRITGFVEELDDVYAEASVVIVPIFFGAGVKFKTLAALAHGVPVVATPAGAEGIYDGETGVFAAVESDPSRFAAAVLAALGSAPSEVARSALAQRVRSDYGKQSYSVRIEGFYSGLLAPLAGEGEAAPR